MKRKSSVIDRLVKGSDLMSLEDAINRLAAAIEAQNNNVKTETVEEEKPAPPPKKGSKGKKTNKGAEAAKAAAKKVKSLSIDDVRVKAKEFIDDNGGTQAQVKDMLNELGAKKLAELDEDKYTEMIEMLTTAIEANQNESDDEEDLI